MGSRNYYIKIYSHQTERLVAICDEDIMELSLESRGVKIKPTKKFYGEQLVTEAEVLTALKECTSANVIGRRIIDLLIKHNIIHKEAILWIDHPDKSEKRIGHAILIK
ncbi:MAG: DUF424 domain-containing protein [Candidatus Heimdallarchaeaceae archaeon]|uniref:DUF424 family protein n=1 Tax=Candidatus Heimdallarchaeum endolithica TaxID=2876572 RepID=A0A9Y1BP92_9ARCH|nr:MAG: DUF424 family protein [Candidatus Heimdallarchaeum endolithica]